MKKIDALVLFLILALALILRLYRYNAPLADFHSWRQADTASVARNFAEKGFDLSRPTYHDFSNVASGVENPHGYRFVEFPLYNALFGALFKYLPLLPLVEYGRLTAAAFSLIIIGVIYYFLLKEAGRTAAIAGAIIYSVFPFFVFFSRVILPETPAISFAFLSLFFLYLFSLSHHRARSILWYTLSLLALAVGLLIKPTVGFYFLGHLVLFVKKYRWNTYKKLLPYLFFATAVIPLFVWRYHISFFPEGVPANIWLISSVNTPEGLQNIFFKPAFFRWIFFERINNIILGGYLTAFFVLGALVKSRKYFLHSLLVSAFLYLFVFQGGNVQHEYYQTLILPVLAIFSGVGIAFLLQNHKLLIPQLISYATILLLFIFSFFISFYRVKDYYSYPQDLVNMASVVRHLTNKEDKIVTDTVGDTTLLFLSERSGAPSVFKELEELKKGGYSYFVTMKRDVIDGLKAEGLYTPIFENNEFAIFAL